MNFVARSQARKRRRTCCLADLDRHFFTAPTTTFLPRLNGRPRPFASLGYLAPILLLFFPLLSLSLLILLFFFFPSRPRRNFLFDAPREPPTRRWLHRLSRNSVTLQPRERSSFPRVRFCCVGNEESPFTRRFFEVFRILGGDCWKRLLRRKSVK